MSRPSAHLLRPEVDRPRRLDAVGAELEGAADALGFVAEVAVDGLQALFPVLAVVL